MSIASESRHAADAPCRPPPEFAYAQIESGDADEAAQRLREWDQVYRQLTPGRFQGLTTEIWFESMQVFRERSNRRIYQAGRAWLGSVAFGIPLAMDGDARFCGQDMQLDSMLVLGPCGELDFLTSPTLDIVGISIPRQKLASLCGSGSAFEPGSVRCRNGLVRMDPCVAAWLRALLRSVFESVEADPARLSIAGLREQICEELAEGLAAAGLDSVAQSVHAERHANQRAIVQRATDYVLAHTDEPIFVERLCEVLGVSRRSLQYAFQHVLGTSPVEYLRAARLHGVRRELKSTSRAKASIQDIAARWGFWHLGHFITHYRQLFGCRPSETPRPA
jgi:AraC family ethanolamine operon transcriptional activator